MAAASPHDLHKLSGLLKEAERVAAKIGIQLTVKVEATMNGLRASGGAKGGAGKRGGILQDALAVLAEAGSGGLDRQAIHERVQARVGRAVKPESLMSALSRIKSSEGAMSPVATRQEGDKTLWFVTEFYAARASNGPEGGQEATP